MKPKRWMLVAATIILVVVVTGALALRGDSEPQRLNTGGPMLTPPAARLLSCGPRFEFNGSSYQVRSVTPFQPGEKLGSVRIRECHDPSKHIVVSVHAYEGVNPNVAVGVRNGMTVLALAPSPCLGLRDRKLIGCLRKTR